MIATGYHKKEVWKSVLFQLIFILYFLQKEQIYFEEFSLENNIYIKDLYFDPVNINYWIYNIDGFDYYVPNYGYLVLFDSKYSDLDSDVFKIRSPKLFPDKNDKNKNTLDKDYGLNYHNLIYNKFKTIFDPDIFTTKLKSMGGFEPEESIVAFIRKIYNDNTSDNINKYIFEYFKDYLHNRIGTNILRSEKELFNILNRPLFNKNGVLLIKQERYDVYKWVLFIKNNNDIFEILNKDINNNFILEHVNSYCLFNYPELIYPNNITEKNIIETFSFISLNI
jgi:hypothetical protein